MNIFEKLLHAPNNPEQPVGPRRVYAKVQRLPEANDSEEVVTFSGIDADWFDETPDALTSETLTLEDFTGARFYTLEISRHLAASIHPILNTIDSDNEDRWFVVEIGGEYPLERPWMLIYYDLLQPPQSRWLSGVSPPSTTTARKLNKVVQLPRKWLAANDTEIEALLAPIIADYAVVYDVGQGCSHGLHEATGSVSAYFDFGGGTLGFTSTYPAGLLRFCFSGQPPIILSHWDSDHWVSASHHEPRALLSTWLVPDQSISPAELVFAHSIASAGKVVIWPAGTSTVTVGSLSVGLCGGTTRNESGLALQLVLNGRQILFTGDCGYVHLPVFPAGYDTAGLVVPHHGGLTSAPTTSPPNNPVPAGKLAYSVGNPSHYPAIISPAIDSLHKGVGWTSANTRKTCDLRPRLGNTLLEPLPGHLAMPPGCTAGCGGSGLPCTLAPTQ